jgi:hypothetical protein
MDILDDGYVRSCGVKPKEKLGGLPGIERLRINFTRVGCNKGGSREPALKIERNP